MTRAIITQMLNALVYANTGDQRADVIGPAIEAAREYLATEPKQRDHPEEHLDMVGDRAELIRQLRDVLGKSVHVDIANEAADMLEADAQPKQVTCQIYGHVVGACVECNTHIEAQQAKPKTMGDVQEMCIAALQRDERAQLIAAHQELNMSNYGPDDVDELNDWANRAYDMLEADAQQRSKPHGHCTHAPK